MPFNKTSISQKSCIPSSIRLWNSLEDDLKNLATLQTFKNITSRFNNTCVPSQFTIGNRHISILHARLRIIAAALIMTFLEIISVIILYVICVAWWRMPSTTFFIAESLQSKGRFLTTQLEFSNR